MADIWMESNDVMIFSFFRKCWFDIIFFLTFTILLTYVEIKKHIQCNTVLHYDRPSIHNTTWRIDELQNG